MDIHVSIETQHKAKLCTKRFSCLDKARRDLCAVEKDILAIVLRLKCQSKAFCYFQYSLGDGCFCGCPVRKEIFHEYHI